MGGGGFLAGLGQRFDRTKVRVKGNTFMIFMFSYFYVDQMNQMNKYAKFFVFYL